MKRKQKKSNKLIIWSISSFVAVMFIGGALGAIKLLLSEDSSKHRRQVQMVTLLKPPPPPKMKEKPPEPEVEKKEEIIEPQEEIEPEPMEDMAQDEGPMDDDLGLDAEGVTGADGFGLKAKKGGRSIIGGAGSGKGLLRKYAWYTAILQEDLRKRVNKHMEENGGVPEGSLVAQIEIRLDESGRITELAIARESGNERMDRAVKEALFMVSVSEPPPLGMPRVMQLKISSKG